MQFYIVAFTLIGDEGASVPAYHIGVLDGLGVTAKPHLAAQLPKEDAAKVVEWLKMQRLRGMSDIHVEQLPTDTTDNPRDLR